MLVATNGKKSFKVHLAHWWPGREFESMKGITGLLNVLFTRDYRPPIPVALMKDAMQTGARYLTYARVETTNGSVAVCARCCPRDMPSRAKGRFIALLRLARALKGMGYKLERSEK